MKNNKDIDKKMKEHSLRFHFALIIFAILIFAMFIISLTTLIFIRFGVFRIILGGPFSIVTSVFLLSLCIATALAYYVNTHILKPIIKLSNASKQVAKGDFDIRIHTKTQIDELNTTFNNFNNMVLELSSIETLRNDFVASVSHEFKTPLSAIEGYATLLQDESLTNEERDEYIRKIQLNTRLLSELTGNILLISKLENQTFFSKKTEFRLDEQIREAILTHEVIWTQKEHELDIDLETLNYKGEENLLIHVWINLIGNALKFTPKGGKISIILKKYGSNAIIKISDTGIGMDTETKKHIFDKFYQGDTSHKGKGNGLGLSLCQKIVTIEGGKIQCESKLAEGSVFTVILPLEAE